MLHMMLVEINFLSLSNYFEMVFIKNASIITVINIVDNKYIIPLLIAKNKISTGARTNIKFIIEKSNKYHTP